MLNKAKELWTRKFIPLREESFVIVSPGKVFLANEPSVRLYILLTCHANLIAEETVKSVRLRSNESKAGYQLDITVILLDPVIWVFKIQFYKE